MQTVNVGDELTQSLWASTDVAPEAESLRGNERAGVVVIGSGIAGLSTAYELMSSNVDVVVLDRGKIGKGMTARTTAHLAPVCDDGSAESIARRGLEAARLAWKSQDAAVDRIEAIVAERAISCGFRRVDAYLFPAPGTSESAMEDELKALKELGVYANMVRGVPFAGLRDAACVRYRNQATIHPLQYLRGLAQALAKSGARLYANTRVTAVEEQDAGVTVTTDGGVVHASAAVVATNSPINDRVALHTKMAPYRTYAMAFTLAKEALPDALFWDSADPYHYVRQHPGPGNVNYLIVGGGDHKTGEADDAVTRFDALEAWIRNLVPELGKETHRWSGQVLETLDYSSFTGRNPGNRNIYVHTGDSGQGITHGAMAGMLIRDLITKGESPWSEVYEPSRKPLRGAKMFVAENVTAIKNFAEYVAPGEITSVDELGKGQGAIVRNGLKKIAAYRDERGKLYQCSAACTHVGCHVHWNSLERCWDCPCHGSQFAVDGTALNGPAVAPLERLD
jgi:glycine/D-amino acid oxidase-like deaminating enzyme/nitrite reductase/ring-hydroxylating ferredoxin subunit